MIVTVCKNCRSLSIHILCMFVYFLHLNVYICVNIIIDVFYVLLKTVFPLRTILLTEKEVMQMALISEIAVWLATATRVIHCAVVCHWYITCWLTHLSTGTCYWWSSARVNSRVPAWEHHRLWGDTEWCDNGQGYRSDTDSCQCSWVWCQFTNNRLLSGVLN